jgi:hypothetical protein
VLSSFLLKKKKPRSMEANMTTNRSELSKFESEYGEVQFPLIYFIHASSPFTIKQ